MRFRPPAPCRSLAALERRARAFLVQWIAAGVVIDEAQAMAALTEDELATLAEAIDRARRSGR